MSIVSKNYNIYVRNSDLGSNVNLIVNFVNVLCTTPKANKSNQSQQIPGRKEDLMEFISLIIIWYWELYQLTSIVICASK